MNKTAILLFGQERTCKKLIDNFVKNIINVNNCDVFIFFWSYYKTKQYIQSQNNMDDDIKIAIERDKISGPKAGGGHLNTTMAGIYNENLNTDYITDMIKPKVCVYEEQVIFNVPNNIVNTTSHLTYQRRMSMYTAFKRVINLYNEYKHINNIEYQNIFITRLGVNFIKPIIFNFELPKFDKVIFANGNNNYFIDYNYFTNDYTLQIIINDIFKYMLNNLECPEKLLAYIMSINNINVTYNDLSNFMNGFRYGYIYPSLYEDYL